ncbi:hypothetical protein V6Z11_D01G077300 [Gossypium hirsutum]
MAAVREALLKRLRVNATSLSLLRNPKPSLNGLFALTFNAVHRRFSDDVMGSFLDKSEVTDRVASVVKNFQKVDPSKEHLRTLMEILEGAHNQFDIPEGMVGSCL